jgi:hypothetical protein
MCEVRRATNGRNTLQYLYHWEGMESSEPGTRVQECAICKIIIVSSRQAYPCSG